MSSPVPNPRVSTEFVPDIPIMLPGLIEICPAKGEPSLMLTVTEHTCVPIGELSGRDAVGGVRLGCANLYRATSSSESGRSGYRFRYFSILDQS
jgi:hypothetical protein